MSNNDERDNEGGEERHDERPETFREEPAYILRSASELSDVNQLVLDAVLDSMHANLYVTDPQTDKILFMNRAMKEEYGLESPEGSVCWRVLQNGLAERCSFCPIDVLSQSGQQSMVMQWEEDSPVTGRLYRNYDSLVTWLDGSTVHLQQSVDITELKTARIDELTGLFTRRFGKDRLREAMDRATAKGESISVCLFDINDLKCVNDAYGHAEGDRFIRAVALAVRREFAVSDFGFRLSGDELVAVFHRDASQVNEAMERVSESLAQEDKGFDHPYDRAFSFGIVEVVPGCGSDARDVLDLADVRMYDQKRSYHIARNEQRSHGIAAGAADAAAGRNAIVPRSTFDYDKDRLYDALVESTDDYLYVCNMKTGVFRYPTAMVEEFGLPGEVIENAAAVWGAHVHEDDRAAFLESNQEITDGRTTRHCIEYRALNRRGEWVWLRCRGRLVQDAVGEPSLFAGFITNLGKKNNVDRATGLFNKFEFKDTAVHALETHPDDEATFMILGIDDFRHVNDRYDRVFGDAVIRLVAQRIQAALPSCASAYRLDGDEFAVFLRGAGAEEIHDMYKRLHATFSHQQEYDGRKFYCTLSAGFARYPENATTYEDLVKRATYALEHAKAHGKNRCVAFSDDIMKGRTRALELMELLRDSVEHGFEGFSLAYQPQIDAATGRVGGAEALARWTCPEYGNVPPDEFIPLLESSGLIVPVGVWVLNQAVQTCKRWSAVLPGFVMDVNLSYRQVEDGTFVDCVRAALHAADLSPKNLVIEMTESYFSLDDQETSSLFSELRALGVRVAMDDFGTGYSTLGILKNVPADIVKIDRTFVRDVHASTFDATFIRFIVALCHDVNINVCLEGVETDEEYAAVSDMGIDSIQGFLFGRPQTAEGFERLYLSKGGEGAVQ